MISPLDSRILDVNSEALGVSVETLMGNAGSALAEVISGFESKRIAFVCGTGNNGGDGFAAAAHFDNATVFLLKPASEIRTEAAKKYYSKLNCEIREYSESELDSFDMIVDCALGTGLNGDIRSPYREFIEFTRSFKGTIISADVPSGFNTDTCVKPSATVTFHDMKEDMTTDNSGTIFIADIGIPLEASLNVGPGDMMRYNIPSKDSHKGNNGRLLVIGGGPYFGAPAMAANAALAVLRTGADLVRIATPESSFPIVASFSPVFVMTKLPGNSLSPEHVDLLIGLSEDSDAVVIGPGLGELENTKIAVRDFVSKCKKPMVVDADGLNALGNDFTVDHAPIILTPHAGEFKRLGGKDNDVLKLASDMKATLLLKGPNDIISDGNRIRINTTGTPAMTGAGTGDVLAGIVGGLLSKGLSPMDAACLGAYISGKAGEKAFEELSYGLIATDIIDRIPIVLKEGLEN